MTNHLVTTLKLESRALIRALDAHPFARRLQDGAASADEDAAFLEQTYHYVRFTRPLLRKAGERLRSMGQRPALAELLLRKAGEEEGHEEWAEGDLAALGKPRGPSSAPCPAIAAYIAWNRFTVEEGSPLAFLGTAYVLEALSASRAGRVAERMRARSEIAHIEEAVTFLRRHADADEGHSDELDQALADINDPADVEAIALSARVTRALYEGFVSGLALAFAANPCG